MEGANGLLDEGLLDNGLQYIDLLDYGSLNVGLHDHGLTCLYFFGQRLTITLFSGLWFPRQWLANISLLGNGLPYT